MKMNKSVSIIAGFAVILLAASCGGNRDEDAANAAENEVHAVEVFKVSRETVRQDAVYSSTVQANIVNNIAPQQSGRIVKINVEVGDFVAADQVLAEMDRPLMEQAGLKLKNAEVEMGRVEQLFKQGGISQSDYDQIVLSYKVAKSAYDNLLENTILRSPIAGVVTARNYDRGDMYNMSQPLFTVQQITPVKLLIAVSESDYTRVRKGDVVSITADALPGQTFEGTIIRIYPTMDAASHTFNVEVHVKNEHRLLRPGMFARATVNFGDNFNVVIPDQAAVKMQGAGTRQVFVLNADGTVSARIVTLGKHFDDRYEVLSGLEEGETIVVKGQATIKSGDTVSVK